MMWESQSINSQVTQESVVKAGNLSSNPAARTKEPPNKRLKVKMNFQSDAVEAVSRQFKSPLQRQ